MKKLVFILLLIPYLLQAQTTISPVNIGSSANDGTGDNLRSAFNKLNNNDASINANKVEKKNSIMTSSSGLDTLKIVYDGTYIYLQSTDSVIISKFVATALRSEWRATINDTADVLRSEWRQDISDSLTAVNLNNCKLSIQVLSSDTIDFVQTTSIISTDTNYTGNFSYSWTGPSAFSSTDNENIVATPGNYYVTVTDDDNGCTAIGYVRVEANFYNLLTENGSGDTYLGLNNVESILGGNLALGFSAMPAITSGYYNIFVGYETTSNVNVAYENIGIGQRALYSLTTGNRNISIGDQSNALITTGSGNITISSGNGTQITTGSGNIVIGNNAASAAGNISNQLWIDNSNTSSPLIFGDFSTNQLTVNGGFTTTGSINVGDTLFYPDGSRSFTAELPHLVGQIYDSSVVVVLAADTYAQLTNAGGDLINYIVEDGGFTIDNDTVILPAYTADYDIETNWGLSTPLGDVVRVAIVSESGILSSFAASTTNVSSELVITVNTNIHGTPGQKIWFEVKTTGGADVTVIDAFIKFQFNYLE